MKRQTIKLDNNRRDLLKKIILEQTYSASNKAKKKAKVILLKSEGKSIKEIIKETNLCKRTIINYVQEYNNMNCDVGGMRFIHKNKYKSSSLKITNVDGDNILLAEFKRKPPLSYKEAAERIKKIFNIAISESATRAYLNKHKIYTKRSKKIIKITNNYSYKQNDRN